MFMDGKNHETYDADSIVALHGLEAVRLRPGMYIGSTDTRGLHHMVFEVVDNGIDEVMAGYATQVDVTINADGSITVVDNGRGIPTESTRKKANPHWKSVLRISTRAKIQPEQLQVSGGLHGVGVSVVNALSGKLIATIHREGKI